MPLKRCAISRRAEYSSAPPFMNDPPVDGLARPSKFSFCLFTLACGLPAVRSARVILDIRRQDGG